MSNPNAWDDKYLIDSWNDALKEYERYHSIHKSGKRLEDALGEDELKELREDYGEYLDETSDIPGEASKTGVADEQDTEMAHTDTNGVENAVQAEIQPQEVNASEQQPAPQHGGLTAAMPQALLGSVEDETLKNMMMSWYYAGYYTGLHTGQQQAPKDIAQKQ